MLSSEGREGRNEGTSRKAGLGCEWLESVGKVLVFDVDGNDATVVSFDMDGSKPWWELRLFTDIADTVYSPSQ